MDAVPAMGSQIARQGSRGHHPQARLRSGVGGGLQLPRCAVPLPAWHPPALCRGLRKPHAQTAVMAHPHKHTSIQNPKGGLQPYSSTTSSQQQHAAAGGAGAPQARVNEYYHHLAQYEHPGPDAGQYLAELPRVLHNDIKLAAYGAPLGGVPLFGGCEPGFLMALVARLSLLLYMPGERIYREGQVGHEMYLISKVGGRGGRGRCAAWMKVLRVTCWRGTCCAAGTASH